MSQDFLTGKSLLVGLGVGLADSGLSSLNSASNLVKHPAESVYAMQEFLATTSGRQLLGAAADSLDVQLNQIAVALQEGGDANAEQLGTSLGLAASIFVSALAGGQTNVAQAASELSKMGIDLTSNAVKTAAAGYKAKSLETKVAKLQAVGRDLDVPNAPSPVEAPPQPNPTPKGDGSDTLASGAKGTTTAGEPAGAPPKNPLLDDSISRDGDRLVVNQGRTPTCGHNSCGMVLDTLGKEVDIGSLIQKIAPAEDGIYARDIANLMTSEGVPASAFGNRNVADLARYTGDGTPVVVRIVDNTKGTDFSHFVVVDGVTTRNGIAVVAIRDLHGAQYFSPVSTFQRNFSGEVVVPRSALK